MMINLLTFWTKAACLLTLILPSSVVAQDRLVETKVAEIRKFYAVVSDRIKASASARADPSETNLGGYYQTDLVVGSTTKPWAAVGLFKVTVRCYFDFTQPSETANREVQLVKVTQTVARASRSYATEFLFDAKGQLIFYFIKPTGEVDPNADALQYLHEPNVEVRCYYEAGKAIRVVVGKVSNETLDKSQQAVAANGLAAAEAVRAVFTASMKVN
jgi:hypothetical protein